MPNVATTRGQPVYCPPSPIADLIRKHRRLMERVYADHQAAMDTWTRRANPLPARMKAS